MPDIELYIHIPFCIRKCKYCDFLSAPATRQVQNAYMEVLLREIEMSAAEVGIPGVSSAMIPRECPVSSIFIGGGTPSAVETAWIVRLMDTVLRCYKVVPDAEITMEVNPGTVSRESLAQYRRVGINRLSIGCQSTNDEELARIGRIHTFSGFLDTYRWTREAGFENVNVDLMNALPGQSLQDVEQNLEKVLLLEPRPEHISAYSLIVEEGTPFFDMWEKGELPLPDEDLEREMYWRTAEILKEYGYVHYEISNFARQGYECRHNCGYWERKDYLGFGIGAASLWDGVRFSNTMQLEEYLHICTEVAENAADGCTHALGSFEGMKRQVQRLTKQEQMEETMFLGLRMARGVGKEAFLRQYGIALKAVYGKELAESIREGLMEERDGSFVLTKRGVDVSNYVMAKFLRG